jgi:glycosyltransferase involved in cell wall biosynthesis
MKMFVIFHGRYPSEKAASLFAAKTAESFASEGLDVTLLVPDRKDRTKEDAFDYFKLQRNFSVSYLPTLNFFKTRFLHRFAFHISLFIFSIGTTVHILRHSKKTDVIYSNETLPLLCASLFFRNCLYEVHDYPEKKKGFYKGLLKRMKWILVTNKWKKEKLSKEFSIPEVKILVELNAVNIEQFDIEISQEEARTELGLPQKKKIVLYTGHLYDWKGVDTLCDAASIFSEDVLTLIVGGLKKDVNEYKERYKDTLNLRFVGHRRHDEIPTWQKAASVLVLPNSGKQDISRFYTSPMKLFEYMVSKRPIIASDLPSIKHIVNKKSVQFFTPDDSQDLAENITKVLKDENQQKKLIEEAFLQVQQHSWKERAKRVLSFISTV